VAVACLCGEAGEPMHAFTLGEVFDEATRRCNDVVASIVRAVKLEDWFDVDSGRDDHMDDGELDNEAQARADARTILATMKRSGRDDLLPDRLRRVLEEFIAELQRVADYNFSLTLNDAFAVLLSFLHFRYDFAPQVFASFRGAAACDDGRTAGESDGGAAGGAAGGGEGGAAVSEVKEVGELGGHADFPSAISHDSSEAWPAPSSALHLASSRETLASSAAPRADGGAGGAGADAKYVSGGGPLSGPLSAPARSRSSRRKPKRPADWVGLWQHAEKSKDPRTYLATIRAVTRAVGARGENAKAFVDAGILPRMWAAILSGEAEISSLAARGLVFLQSGHAVAAERVFDHHGVMTALIQAMSPSVGVGSSATRREQHQRTNSCSALNLTMARHPAPKTVAHFVFSQEGMPGYAVDMLTTGSDNGVINAVQMLARMLDLLPDASAKAIFEAGAVAGMLQFINKALPKSRGVGNAALAISLLAQHHVGAAEEIVEAGGVQSLLDIVNSSDAGVHVINAILGLTRLSVVTPAASYALVEAQAIPTLVNFLLTHGIDAPGCSNCLHILGRCVLNVEGVAETVSADLKSTRGGLRLADIIVKMIAEVTHSTRTTAVWVVCRMLERTHDACAKTLVEAGAIDALIAMIRATEPTASGVGNASLALAWIMSSCEGASATVATYKPGATLVSILEHGTDQARSCASEAVNRLLENASEAAADLIDAGSIKHLVDMCESGPPAGMAHASMSLAELIEGVPACALEICERGSVKSLVRMLHDGSERAKIGAAAALARIVEVVPNAAYEIEAELGVTHIANVIKTGFQAAVGNALFCAARVMEVVNHTAKQFYGLAIMPSLEATLRAGPIFARCNAALALIAMKECGVPIVAGVMSEAGEAMLAVMQEQLAGTHPSCVFGAGRAAYVLSRLGFSDHRRWALAAVAAGAVKALLGLAEQRAASWRVESSLALDRFLDVAWDPTREAILEHEDAPRILEDRSRDPEPEVAGAAMKVLGTVFSKRVLIAQWSDGRELRRNGEPGPDGNAKLRFWAEMPKAAMAEVLLMTYGGKKRSGGPFR